MGLRMRLTCQNDGSLQRLAQPHVICQHPVQATLAEKREPADASQLVLAQVCFDLERQWSGPCLHRKEHDLPCLTRSA